MWVFDIKYFHSKHLILSTSVFCLETPMDLATTQPPPIVKIINWQNHLLDARKISVCSVYNHLN